MNTQKQILSDKIGKLNLQINSQLKRTSKPLSEMPPSDWKSWILELISINNTYIQQLNSS